MLELFQMWALVEALGLLCLPLTMTVFHNLPDRGWAFSKAIGVALLAFCIWLPLMVLHFLPFTQLFIAGVLLILLAFNLVGYVRMHHAIAKSIRLNIPYIVLVEIIFLGMVFLLGYMRSYLPDIRNYEMYMDEGFITAIMRSAHFPPNDMWFAGASLNYYYYAHFTVAMLAKLLGQSPSIAFNTGISMFFGLTASNLFGVTCNIVAWAHHLRTRVRTSPDTTIEHPDLVHPPLLQAVPYGVLTMAMGLVLGNLASTQTWWKMHGDVSQDPYYWFNATRVITKTINEFPAFSFLLSCFHAHVLTLAFTIVAIGLAFNLFLEADGRGLNVFGHGWRLPLTLGTTALILGGLYTMNGWDFPTYLALALVCIILQQWLTYDAHISPALFLDIFTASGSLIALSFLFYIPFYLNFSSPAQGIGIVSAADRSQLSDELLIYGLFAFMFLSLLFASALKRPLIAFSMLRRSNDIAQGVHSRRNWLHFALVGIIAVMIVELITLVLMKNGITFVLAADIALLGAILVFVHLGDRAHAFTLLLGAVAFALVAFCEVLFLKDVFADSFPRMNTVFKMYFQAWALLSIASGAGLYFILESFKPLPSVMPSLRNVRQGLQILWSVGLLFFLLAGSVYPLTAPSERLARNNPKTGQPYLQRSNSLDGLTYLQTDPGNPGDYKAIRWLNENVQGDPVIIESIGSDYSNWGRISVFTGLPTLMGWVGHEYQWRANWINNPTNNAEFTRRGADVDTIYTNPHPDVVLSVMNYYHAQYLYVGPLEYMKYRSADLHRFSMYMQLVYNTDGVTIYKMR
ncbi:MAG: DUF2298 domain-containing protein [Ktedonobacteraceae bacterium]